MNELRDRLRDESGMAMLWYGLTLVFVILVPCGLWLKTQPWSLEPEDQTQFFGLAAAHLAFALLMRATPGRLGLPRFLVTTSLGGVLCYLGAWIVMSRLEVTVSRGSFMVGFLLSFTTVLLPYVIQPRWLALAGMAAASLVAAVWQAPAAPTPPTIAATALHTVRITFHPDVVPAASLAVEGGAIAEFGDGFLLATADGDFYRLDWAGAEDSLKSDLLPFKADPFNLKEFVEDQENPSGASVFRIADLLIDQSRPDAPILFLAHHHWNEENRCLTLRVSRTELPVSSAEKPVWTTVYDTVPCLRVGPVHPSPYTLESGGALALHGEGLLLTVGDNAIEGLDGEPAFAQDKDVNYGKVLLLDPGRLTARVFTSGHRNPQGLAVDSAGTIWETEHGPQGGDELNILSENGNYGWPFATYGTQYGLESWPLSKNQHDHGHFREPAHAFVPSIGVSQLIEIRRPHFSGWTGDLLLSSLRRQALIRVRTRGTNVVYAETIPVGHRIRDLAEGKDGRIVIFTDTGRLLSLSRMEGSLSGQTVYSLRCEQCHQPSPGSTTSVAPSLRGIVGKRIASAEQYGYSSAMQAMQGDWTEERLGEFLKDPEGYLPGTNMEISGIESEKERNALIEFLRTYR